jgi:hypothetical protein
MSASQRHPSEQHGVIMEVTEESTSFQCVHRCCRWRWCTGRLATMHAAQRSTHWRACGLPFLLMPAGSCCVHERLLAWGACPHFA